MLRVKPQIEHGIIKYKNEILTGCVVVMVIFMMSMYTMTAPVLPGDKAVAAPSVLKSGQNIVKSYISKTDEPLVVLFTTLKMSQAKSHIYDNTIRNWAQLKPAVRPVLYYEGAEEDWISKIKNAGWWDVYPARGRFEGIPILKHIFADVIQRYPKAKFYAFANADILFDESLVVTLEAISKKYQSKEMILTGRRVNAYVGLNMAFRDFHDIRKAADVWNSQLFNDGFAQDYIIATKSALPWERIPDFLVGRAGYTTWITAYALTSKINTFDLTNTVLALHQTDKSGVYESKYTKLSQINKDIIGPEFDYELGKIDCLKYESRFIEESPFFKSNKSVAISVRDPNPCQLLFDKYRINTDI